MSSWTKVKEEALIASKRHCCLCHEFKGLKIEVHHIVHRSEGGKDEFDNAIPLCFDCHGDMRSYDAKHPKGAKYSRGELKKRRDDLYLFLEKNPDYCNTKQCSKFTAESDDIAPNDKNIFAELLNLDRRNGIISYLRNKSFYSGIDVSRLDSIHDFKSSLDITPLYFCDTDMNSLLNDMFDKFSRLSRVLGQKLFYSRSSPNQYEIPKDRGEDAFYSDADQIQECAESAITAYDRLVKLGTQRGF